MFEKKIATLILAIFVAGIMVFPVSLATCSETDNEVAIDFRPVSIESEGWQIKGLLIYPEGAVEAPAVIELHGFTGSKDVHTNERYMYSNRYTHESIGKYDLTEAFCSRGYVLLLIDLRGHGDTLGAMDYGLMVKDVSNAITFLQEQPEVDGNRIGLFGHSLGGMVACVVAGMDERVKATALWAAPAGMEISAGLMVHDILNLIPIIGPMLSGIVDMLLPIIMGMIPSIVGYLPFGALDSLIGLVGSVVTLSGYTPISIGIGAGISPEGFYFMIGSCKIYLHHLPVLVKQLTKDTPYPIDYVGKISPRPLLIVQGQEDTTVHPGNSELLYENAGEPTTIVRVKNTDHYFTDPEDKRDEVLTLTAEWFADNL